MRWITVSTGEMAMTAYLCVVRRKRFLANVTTRRATIHLPLFFRHCFDSVSNARNSLYLISRATDTCTIHLPSQISFSTEYIPRRITSCCYMKHSTRAAIWSHCSSSSRSTTRNFP